MEIIVEPTPEPEEQEVLERALSQPAPDHPRGAWWRAGLRELGIGEPQPTFRTVP